MRGILLLVILIALIFGPQLWTKYVFGRYRAHREDFEGTGAELARHLLDRFNLRDVKVETTEMGDHYDPEAKAVRLAQDNYHGQSLTAVTVAAHEVGHAIQDDTGYAPLQERTRLVRIAHRAERVGSMVMLGIPVVAALTRAPTLGLLVLFAGLVTMGISTLIHVITLPVEWDASFGRALPVLKQGRYIPEQDMDGARRILRAAALTYLAVSLASLLNLWRWITFLRR